jgi:transcriptional regulator with XRE-family HTH domain
MIPSRRLPAPNPQQLADRVRRLRAAQGLTRGGLARRAGVTFTELNRIENASWKQRQSPERVLRLAIGLAVPPHALLRDAFGDYEPDSQVGQRVARALQRLTPAELARLRQILDAENP